MGLEDRHYYREESKGWQPSYRYGSTARSIIWYLVVINVVIFFVDLFTPRLSPGVHWLDATMALSQDSWKWPWLWWKFVTYGFAHTPLDRVPNGLFHIAANMLVLWFLGRSVEDRYGSREFLWVYMVAIVVSGVIWTLFVQLTEQTESVIGASGAVSTIVILFVFNFPREIVLLFGVLPMRAWVLGVLIVVLDILHSFSPESRTAWQAHLGGIAFGALYYRLNWRFERISGWRPASSLSVKKRLKVFDPDSDFEALKLKADAILEKISTQGEESLSNRERKLLEKYSAQLRRRRK